jgi:UDP-N-acetylmuramate dehydrogenase
MATEPSGAIVDLTRELSRIEGLTVRAGESLAEHSTLKIGGPAQWYVEAGSEGGLVELLALAGEADVPIQILGLGSNILFPDEGLSGVVVRLTGEFEHFEIAGTRVTVGAALALSGVARRTAREGLTGLEALSGFPSTIGGAVYMNAGCYGTEISDVLASAKLVDPDGTSRRVTARQLEPRYRETNLAGTSTIVIQAVFDLVPGDSAVALARIDELNQRRWRSLPAGVANAGSIFKNPPDDYAGRLIDECGLKGKECGGARISPRHANVIVNEGGASARDVLSLMLTMRRAVRAEFGVDLIPELVLAGSLSDLWRSRPQGDARKENH